MLRLIRLAVCTSLSTCLLSSVMAEDWPQFRGPGGLGISAERELPVEWGPGENIDWKVPLPGFGASSPITLGDRIFLTCYSGYGTDRRGDQEMEDLRLHVVALEQASGEIAWNTTLKPRLPESDRVRDHGYAGSTPVTDGERLYVFFGKTGVFAFDLNGEQLWNTTVGDKTHGWGSATSPVLYKDLVIVNASVESSSLVGLDKRTGEEVWRADGMRSAWNTPLLVTTPEGNDELVVSVHSRILGFDPATGEELWTCEGINDYVCPSVVAKDGVVYAIGGRKDTAVAVKTGGRGDVTDSHVLWRQRVGSNVTSPVVVGEHLYWVSDDGIAYCIKLEDGSTVYRKRLSGAGRVYASTTAADGKLYNISRSGTTFVLGAKPEFEELAQNELDDSSIFNASPVVSDGQLLLRSDEYLYCIGK